METSGKRKSSPENKAQKVSKDSSKPKDSKKSLKKTLVYAFSLAILIIIVVTFIGTPAVSMMAGPGRFVFGRYGNREILYAQGNFFQRQYQALAAQYRDSLGTDNIELQLRLLWREAFNRAAFHAAVMVAAEESGLVVSEDHVDRELAQRPEFQEDGRFSRERFLRMSSAERFSLRNFIRESLVYELYIDDLISGSLTNPAELEFVTAMAENERQFSFVTFPFQEFPAENVRAYAEDNADLFRRINLSSITVRTSRAEAENIRTQAVDRVASFEDLARNHSEDRYATQGGERGWVYYYELEPDFADSAALEPVFSLDAGQIGPVIETIDGWVIYRVEEPAEPFDLEGSLSVVRRYMDAFERGIIEDTVRARAEGFRAQALADGFSEAASGLGVAPSETAYFPINYGNQQLFRRVSSPADETFARAAFQTDFFIEAFSLPTDGVSSPIVVGDSVRVLKLQSERTAGEDTLDDVEYAFPFIVQQFQSNQLENAVFDHDRFDDRFNEVYSSNEFQRFLFGG